MNTRDTTIEENFLIIRIGDRLKTTSSNYHVGKIKLELISLTINVWYKKQCPELKSSSKTKVLKTTDGYLKDEHPTVFYPTVVRYYFFARNG